MGRKRGYGTARSWRNVPEQKRGVRQGERRDEDIAPAQNDNLTSCRDAWLQQLEVLNYRPSTINGRRQTLLYFLEWAHARDLNDPAQITRRHLLSYSRWLMHYRKKNGKPLSIKSRRDRLQVLRQFFAWLCKENLLEANPASEIELPRQESRLPPPAFSEDEIRQLMAAPDIFDPLGLRDRAILELLYSTGVRRGEAVKLELRDVHADSQTLFVRQGKGSKDRYVPIGERALEWLERYLERSRPLLDLGVGSPALFLSGLGDAFHPDAFGSLVAGYVKRTLERNGGCHLFRHSCATHMLEHGADIRYIQQLLGHAQLETTSLYTQVSIKQLREVHAKTHPANAPKKSAE